MNKKWEYLVLDAEQEIRTLDARVGMHNLKVDMDRLGQEGWEHYDTNSFVLGTHGVKMYLFFRKEIITR